MRAYPAELFRRVLDFERIDGAGAVSAYLHRWRLFALPGGRRLYLHHFVGSDWSRDRHDHPKNFTSIGLFGGYVEEYALFPVFEATGARPDRKQFRAPWIRYFDARHIHRLRVSRRGCWTLVWVGRTRREWGFWRRGEWIPWFDYVRRFGGSRT